MARYLIKTTYLSGPHKGTSHLLRKKGYVTNESAIQWDDTTYASKGIALRECRRLKADNDFNVRFERQERERKAKKGWIPHEWFIYEEESYEPYEVPEDKLW